MKNTTMPIIWVIFLLFVPCFTAYSEQIYRWVDEKGNINYTTRYDWIPQQYRNQISEPPEKTMHKKFIATEEEVRQFFTDYIERYTKKDLDGFLSLFSPKAVQNQRDRFDEIKNIYSDFFNKSHELRYHIEDMMIRIYQNTLYVIAYYEVRQILKKEGKSGTWRGDIRWVLVRENGALKIRYLDYRHYKHQKSP